MVKLTSPAIAGIALGFALLSGVHAQDAASPAAPAAGPAAPVVDESALRYFARQGDERRLQAEIARLSAIYPGWTPPADPLATDSGIDENLQSMWDLYGKGDIAGVQAAIDARRAANPEWRPPQDLLTALANGSAAAAIRAAASTQNSREVIKVAANHADILTCANVDLLWALGEAFVDTGDEKRGLDAYAYVLQHCSTKPERLATMQKARTMLGGSDLESLFTYEQGDEFASIRIDQARQSVADFLNGISTEVDPKSVTLIEDTIAATPSADDLRLLGYYQLQLKQPRRARDYFQDAKKIDDSPASVAGLALSLVQLRDLAGAEALLADFRTDTPELETQYLSIANALLSGDPPRRLSSDVLDRIIQAVSDSQDAVGAQALGWYAFNFGQTQTAIRWFQEALSYNPEYEPAAYGMLVASQKLQDRDAVRDIIRQWGSVSPRIQQFGKPGAPTEAPDIVTIPGPDLSPTAYRFNGAAAFLQPAVYRFDQPPAFMLVADQTPAQRQAFQQCGNSIPAESLSPAQALPRAWCLLTLERSAEAEAAFQRAVLSPAVKARTDAYYGLTLAQLRLGLIEEAAVSASAMPQTAERVEEMQIAILGTTAVTYFQIGRYDEVLQLLDQRAMLAPEQNDLLTIRAWSYYHLNRYREAHQIFAAVAAAGYPDAQRGLEALAAKGYN